MEQYPQISQYVFNCDECPNRCDDVSKLNYNFENDAAFSENYEQKLINYINHSTRFSASKTTQEGYPDIEVAAENGMKFYIEMKVQQRTFMKVAHFLPESELKPSETVALNLSDLERYFELETKDGITIFIFWVVLNRPCIVPANKENYYYRLVAELKPIWLKEKHKRRFKRKSGEGDIVNGRHKGVTVNYHFSLSELKNWKKNL